MTPSTPALKTKMLSLQKVQELAQQESNQSGEPRYVVQGWGDRDEMIWEVVGREDYPGEAVFTARPQEVR